MWLNQTINQTINCTNKAVNPVPKQERTTSSIFWVGPTHLFNSFHQLWFWRLHGSFQPWKCPVRATNLRTIFDTCSPTCKKRNAIYWCIDEETIPNTSLFFKFLGDITWHDFQQRVDGWWWMNKQPTPQQLKLGNARISCEHPTRSHTQKTIFKPMTMMRNVLKMRTCKTPKSLSILQTLLPHSGTTSKARKFETQQLGITRQETRASGHFVWDVPGHLFSHHGGVAQKLPMLHGW